MGAAQHSGWAGLRTIKALAIPWADSSQDLAYSLDPGILPVSVIAIMGARARTSIGQGDRRTEGESGPFVATLCSSMSWYGCSGVTVGPLRH